MWRLMTRRFHRSSVSRTTGPCPWKCSEGTPVVISRSQANKLRSGKAVKTACTACKKPVTAQTEGKTPQGAQRVMVRRSIVGATFVPMVLPDDE